MGTYSRQGSLSPSLSIKGHHQSKSIRPSVIIDQRSLLIKVPPSVRHYRSKVIINQSLSLRPSLSIIVCLYQSKVIIDQSPSLRPALSIIVCHYRSKVIIDQRSRGVSLCVIVCHCLSLCIIVCHCVSLCVIGCHCVSLCVIVLLCV